MAILTCNNLSFNYKKLHLEQLSFSLEKNRILAVVGEEHSGKSALLQLLAGRFPDAYNCNATIAGFPFLCNAARQQTAFVFHSCPFPLHLTAFAQTEFFSGSYPSWNQHDFYAYCDSFAIPVHTPLSQLSEEQRMLFQFAFAFSHNAALYILDEPLCVLSEPSRKKIWRILWNIVQSGEHGILYAARKDLKELENIATDVLWLKNGKQLLFADKSSFLSHYRIARGTPKQLRYIRQLNPDCFLYEHPQVSYSEGLLFSLSAPLPLNLDIHQPTLTEFMWYYDACLQKRDLNLLEII